MPLNNLAIQQAKPGPRIIKLSDSGGLQLWITPDGAKRWRLAYRLASAQKVLAIGVYPDVSLKDARAAREAAKKLISSGQDPVVAKRLSREAQAVASSNTFAILADELLARKRSNKMASATIQKVEWLLNLARPSLGSRPINDIKAPEVLRTLRKVESRGRLESARRLRSTISEVFRHAVQTGRADQDPTGALKGALVNPSTQHRAAIIEEKPFGQLLRAIAGYRGAPETRAALDLLVLTFVRPGELRAATWAEFDLEAAVWSIPAERMKMRKAHDVPLASPVIAILRDLKTISGRGKYLFPSVRTSARCMSENTINAALRRLGYSKEEVTGHGFRSTASSILNVSKEWSADAIERQLAHVDSNKIRGAYNRSEFWDERVKMMTWWADRCEAMRRGGTVIAPN
jgi:integrase